MYNPIPPREALRYLRDIENEEKWFYPLEGPPLTNLFDLYAFLRNCGEVCFRHHVEGPKNDFAEWVENVVQDKKLSSAMRNCLLKQPMQYRVMRRINHLVNMSVRDLSWREEAEHILSPTALPEESFKAADGRVLRDIWDLRDFLMFASQEAYEKHVNENKNDISRWVDGVLMDKMLSERLATARSREEMLSWVLLRLMALEEAVGHDRAYRKRVMRALKRG